MSDTETTETLEATDRVTVTINGTAVEAAKGELVIEVAERAGVYIPRFCYHPRMRSVGMCRMCIVDIDTGRGPALLPACMIEAAPDMVVDTESPTTKKAQDGVLEFLLINHPLDCPVCDKGGECPLQDQTIAYGPGESRFVEEKVHFPKPIPISETVYLDRERCILCDRCTRFAKEVAGDPLIHFAERGAVTEIATFPTEPFSSYFSGNTVQICPVGALTAKPYRFRARPWDLEEADSTCTSCAVGCRVAVQTSCNRVLRYEGVDVDPVNWGWLCDKGRFGFEAVNSEDRLAHPLVRHETTGDLNDATWGQALHAAADHLRAALDAGGPTAIGLLGGARLTNEDAYAWAKLAKGVLGTDNVDAQLGDGLPAEAVLGLPRATIDETCAADGTVLLIGPDLKEELPVLYLRLRHAAVNDGVRLVEVSPQETGLTPYAGASVRYLPGELSGAVDEALDGTGDGPLTVVLGRPSLAESPDGVLAAAAAIIAARPGTRFLPALRRANVFGALDMGLAPGVLPGRVSLDAGRDVYTDAWSTVPAEKGLDAAGILSAAAAGEIHTLVLLGADPLTDFPDADLARRAFDGVSAVIAVDLFRTPSVDRAQVILPAAGYAECSGTTTNLEGRVSTVEQRITPPGTSRSDWMIAADLARRLDGDLGVESTDQIWAEIERLAPSHRGADAAALLAAHLTGGLVVPIDGSPPADSPPAITFEAPSAREDSPPHDAYSLRLVSARRLYDAGTLLSHSPSSAGLAPGARLALSPKDFDRLGLGVNANSSAPGDVLPVRPRRRVAGPLGPSQVRVRSARGEVTVPAVAHPGLPVGVASLDFNQPGGPASALIDGSAAVTDIRVETAGES